MADIGNARKFSRGCPGATELANRTLAGEMAGYRWQLDAQPFRAAFLPPHAQTPWMPETIVLTVLGPGGAPLSFDMIRLVRAAGK